LATSDELSSLPYSKNWNSSSDPYKRMLTNLHTAEVEDFIQKHKDEKPHELALKAGRYPELPIKYIAHQVQCYQKAKIKLPDFSSQANIIYPLGISLEQSSSEPTALY